jgi:hypothetical protein
MSLLAHGPTIMFEVALGGALPSAVPPPDELWL